MKCCYVPLGLPKGGLNHALEVSLGCKDALIAFPCKLRHLERIDQDNGVYEFGCHALALQTDMHHL